jgi:hypothetical protein
MAMDVPAATSVAPQTIPPTQNIIVNHDNVLKAARIIQDALDNEGNQILAELDQVKFVAPGHDVVSEQAAKAWNARVVTDPDSYANQIRGYLDNLQTLAGNLATAAKQYGYTDDQIAAAFRPGGPGA